MKVYRSFFLVLLVFVSCTPYFLSSRFEAITANHQVVAVLPFEIRFTGVMPDKLSEADILELEEAESRAFQISFFRTIIKHWISLTDIT